MRKSFKKISHILFRLQKNPHNKREVSLVLLTFLFFRRWQREISKIRTIQFYSEINVLELKLKC